MPEGLPQHPAHDGRLIDANLHLLDRQLLDRDGRPILAIGDLRIERRDDGRHVVTQLLLGFGLTARFFGAHRPVSDADGVPWSSVTEVGSAITTNLARDDVPALWVERWWRDRVIAPIPGGRHDPG